MKLTKENALFIHGYDDTASCRFWVTLHARGARVIECPKMVRIEGKQYVVKELWIEDCYVNNLKDLTEIRVPSGVDVKGLSYGGGWHGKLVYY